MKKRLFIILLALCMATCLLAVPASAEEVASGTCGDNLTWVLTDDGTLIISGEGEMSPFGSVTADVELMGGLECNEPWALYSDAITSVVIEEGITTIAFNAFTGFQNLKHVSIPDSVVLINDWAFAYCDGLTNINLPVGLEEIGSGAFECCTALTEIMIPKSVNVIESNVFSGCTTLKEIKIETGNDAYCVIDGLLYNIDRTELVAVPAGRSGIVTIPNGVTDIGTAFRDCPYITEVIVPEGITELSYEAFMMCRSMTTFTFPESISFVSYDAFLGCSSLETVYFLGDAPGFSWFAFSGCEFSAYYPAGNATWTDDVMKNHDATITWIPYTPTPFTDAEIGSWYYDPVLWAVENGITNGLTEDSFGPTATCNRAQVVTFLWRAANCPEPTSAANPFVDVAKGSFYEKPVLWAVENGITNGADATHFNPTGVCNRAQVVTFLYRAFESPAVSTSGLPFTDVPSGAWYEAPIAWAVENGITNGLSATEFGPNASCNRAQVVTFLYRAYN